MGSITTEAGVLKLVRPGRRLEVHKEAITAAEVMKRYPRHSITRPDIFEFPWIVVKPEAVLPPGKVFFIVPNRTIYQLLKAREHAAQPPTEHKDSTTDHRHRSLSEKISPPKGVTSKHLDQRRRLKQQFFSFSCATVSPSDDEPESNQKGPQTDIQIGAGAEVSLNKKTTRRDLKQKPPMHSIVGTRKDKEHERRKNDIAAKIAGLKIRESTQVILMKSCLRKPESARKMLCLKVNFTLPQKEEEQVERQRRDSDPRKQYPGYSSR